MSTPSPTSTLPGLISGCRQGEGEGEGEGEREKKRRERGDNVEVGEGKRKKGEGKRWSERERIRQTEGKGEKVGEGWERGKKIQVHVYMRNVCTCVMYVYTMYIRTCIYMYIAKKLICIRVIHIPGIWLKLSAHVTGFISYPMPTMSIVWQTCYYK